MNNFLRGKMKPGDVSSVTYYTSLETRHVVDFRPDSVQVSIEHQTESGVDHYQISMLSTMHGDEAAVMFVARKIAPDYRGIAVFSVTRKKWARLAERHARRSSINFFGSVKVRPDFTIKHNITVRGAKDGCEWSTILLTQDESDGISLSSDSILLCLDYSVLNNIIEHLGVAMFEMEKENAAMRTRA